jgi:hypothetical protein
MFATPGWSASIFTKLHPVQYEMAVANKLGIYKLD